MRMPPLLADFSHARPCKPFCENSLTLPPDQFSQLRLALSLRFGVYVLGYAVLSLQSGCDIKTVQENLGHYAAAFTLDTYGHVTEQMRRDGAEKINNFIESMEKKMG